MMQPNYSYSMYDVNPFQPLNVWQWNSSYSRSQLRQQQQGWRNATNRSSQQVQPLLGNPNQVQFSALPQYSTAPYGEHLFQRPAAQTRPPLFSAPTYAPQNQTPGIFPEKSSEKKDGHTAPRGRTRMANAPLHLGRAGKIIAAPTPGKTIVAPSPGTGKTIAAPAPGKTTEKERINNEPDYKKFENLFNSFLRTDNSSAPALLDELVEIFKIFAEKPTHLDLIYEFIEGTILKKTNLKPHVKMRAFWLLAEIYRKKYDCCFGRVRSTLRGNVLFQNFLEKYGAIKREKKPELQAIFCYWRAIVPQRVMNSIKVPNCWKNAMQMEGSLYQTMRGFYSNSGFGTADGPRLIPNQNVKTPTPLPLPSKETLVPLPTPQSQPQPSNVESKMMALQVKFNNLLRIDHSERERVPTVAAELLYSLLEHGIDEAISTEIVSCLKRQFLEGDVTKYTRILWVIGYLFFPAHARKIQILKKKIDEIASNAFWGCLKKVSTLSFGDALAIAREELRVILRFWRDFANPEIISSILEHINDTATGKPQTRFSWVLKDEDIKKDSRIQEFYSNTYLKPKLIEPNDVAKGSKIENQHIHPDHSAKVPPSVNSSSFIKDNSSGIFLSSDEEADIIQIPLIDKRDIIEIKSSKSKELCPSTLTKRKPDVNKETVKKKKTKSYVEGDTNLFSDFLIIRSRPSCKSSDASSARSEIPSGGCNLNTSALNSSTLTKLNSTNNSLTTGRTIKSTSTSGFVPNFSSVSDKTTPQPTLSRLELFRKKMEKDKAITSLNYNWGDSSTIGEGKVRYLRPDWTVDEFVANVFCEYVESWDIVKMPTGELRVQLKRK